MVLLSGLLVLPLLGSPNFHKFDLIISEIHYHPLPGREGRTFIEIYNRGSGVVDLGSWRLTGDGAEPEELFRFPSGTRLPPRAYALVALDPSLFRAADCGSCLVLGPLERPLNYDGEKIALLSSDGFTVEQVRYADGDLAAVDPESGLGSPEWAPGGGLWPSLADGRGASLERRDPFADPRDPHSWQASAQVGGTPGVGPQALPVERSRVRINELNRSEGKAWIELWSDSTGSPPPGPYRIASGEDLSAYVLTALGGQEHYKQVSLPAVLVSSELFLLLSADGTELLDAFEVPSPGVSKCGRYPDGKSDIYVVSHSTPADPNSAPLLPELLVTEIMACTVPQGGYSWEELQYVGLSNRGSEPVSLAGWRLSGSVGFDFGAPVVIAPGEEVVVARNPEACTSVWGVAALGPFRGVLSVEAGTVMLFDPKGNLVDRVSYGPCDRTAQAPRALNLRSLRPEVDNSYPEAWTESAPTGGLAPSAQPIAPVVAGVRHAPAVLRPGEEVLITARVMSSDPGLQVEVRYGRDGGSLQSAALRDDGTNGDLRAGDGIFTAAIGPFAVRGIYLFHIIASDSNGTTDAPGAGRDFIFPVESSAPPRNGYPAFRILMTAQNRDRLKTRSIWSEEFFDATVIDENGKIHYNAGVRYGGRSLRVRQSGSLEVRFFEPGGYNGLHGLFVGVLNPAAQFLAFDFFGRSGLPAPRAKLANLFFADSWNEGVVLVEPVDLHLAYRICGQGPRGLSLLHGVRSGNLEADFSYRGENPDSYVSLYSAENPRAGVPLRLIELTRVLDPTQTSDEDFSARIGDLIDIDQWLLFFAVQACLGNEAEGITADSGHQYSLLFRPDGRAILLPGELDETFKGYSQRLFRPTLTAIRRLLTYPPFARRFYSFMEKLVDGPFWRTAMGRSIRRLEGAYSFGERDAFETYMARRLGFLSENLPRRLTVAVAGVSAPTYLGAGTRWRYFKGTSDPSGGDLRWTQLGFDDSSWSEAFLPLGYGPHGQRTTLSDMKDRYTTVFLRARFTLSAEEVSGPLHLRIRYDDGVVAYLNGTEIIRRVAPAGIPRYTWRAPDHASNPQTVELDESVLRPLVRPGENVLAAVGLNWNPASRDFFIDIELSAGSGGTEGGGAIEKAFVSGSELELKGTAPASETVAVLVNGLPAGFDPVGAKWQAVVKLAPGENQVQVEAFGATGAVVAESSFPVSLVSGFTVLSGSLSSSQTLRAEGGPYLLRGTLTVPQGRTLRIDPGVVLVAEPDSSIVVEGRIAALGSEERPIYFFSARLSDSWRGVGINNTGTGSSDPVHIFRHCRFIGGRARSDFSGFISPEESRLVLEGCYFEWIRSNVLDGRDSEVTVSGCRFYDVYEAVHFAASDVTVEDTVFGFIVGDKDAVDFDGDGPKPCRIERCTIASSMDDGLDLASTTCFVLGNRFFYCGDKALSFEGDGRHGHSVIKDNVIADSGTAVALKSGSVVEEGLHNTIVGNEAGIRIYAKQTSSPGSRGAFAYSIIWHNVVDIEVDSKSTGTFEYCDIGGPELPPGPGNIQADPLFVDEGRRLFALAQGSPCILGEGLYMGAVPPGGGIFVRGDANRDWQLDISDPVFILLYLFGDAAEPPCADACDVDDDGAVQINDAVYLLDFLYAGGPPPPAPFPLEGTDPTTDTLTCNPTGPAR